MTEALYIVTFWGAIVFTIFGAVLGLCGLWIPKLRDSDTMPKLIITDAIFAGSSIIVAVITKFLGKA